MHDTKASGPNWLTRYMVGVASALTVVMILQTAALIWLLAVLRTEVDYLQRGYEKLVAVVEVCCP